MTAITDKIEQIIDEEVKERLQVYGAKLLESISVLKTKLELRDKYIGDLEEEREIMRMNMNTMQRDADEKKKRVQELSDAIREHYATFPDEPLPNERDLWKTVGIELYADKHGLYRKSQIDDRFIEGTD